MVPALWARLHGVTFTLDRSNDDWSDLVRLKETRDRLTHARFDGTTLPPDYPTDPSELRDMVFDLPILSETDWLALGEGLEVLWWYAEKLQGISQQFDPPDSVGLTQLFWVLQIGAWNAFRELDVGPDYPISKFRKEFPEPVSPWGAKRRRTHLEADENPESPGAGHGRS